MSLTYGELLDQLHALDLPEDAPVRWVHTQVQPRSGIYPIQSTVATVGIGLVVPNACYLVEGEVLPFETPPNAEEVRRIVEGMEP